MKSGFFCSDDKLSRLVTKHNTELVKKNFHPRYFCFLSPGYAKRKWRRI